MLAALCVLGNELACQEKSVAKFVCLWLRHRLPFDFGVYARPRLLQPVDVTIGVSRGPAAALELFDRVWHCQGSPRGPPSFHELFGSTLTDLVGARIVLFCFSTSIYRSRRYKPAHRSLLPRCWLRRGPRSNY